MFASAGSRLRTTGTACLETSERSRSAGAPSLNSGSLPRSAAGSARVAGSSAVSAGPACEASGVSASSAVLPVASVPGSSSIPRRSAVVSSAKRGKRLVGPADELAERAIVLAQRIGELAEVVDRAPELTPAAVDRVGDLARQLERRRPGLVDLPQRRAAVLDAAPCRVQQRHEPRARVGVQRGEDLVEVDRRRGVGDAEDRVVGEPRRLRAARLDLDRHVVQRRPRAHDHVGVGPDVALGQLRRR